MPPVSPSPTQALFLSPCALRLQARLRQADFRTCFADLRLDKVESGVFLPLIMPGWNEFLPCIRPENVIELGVSGATAQSYIFPMQLGNFDAENFKRFFPFFGLCRPLRR